MQSHSTNFTEVSCCSDGIASSVSNMLDYAEKAVTTKLMSGKIALSSTPLPINRRPNQELEEYYIPPIKKKNGEIMNKRKYYMDTFKEKQKQCKEFTHNIKISQSTVKKILEAKKAQIEEKHNATRKLIECELEKELQEKQNEEMQKKSIKHEIFNQLLEMRKKEREIQIHKKSPKVEYIYQKLEKKYKQNELLEKTIDFHKINRITIKDIKEHQIKYSILRNIKELERKKGSKESQKHSPKAPSNYELPRKEYESKIYHRNIQIEQNRRKAMLLQELYPPITSKKKKEEIENRIQKAIVKKKGKQIEIKQPKDPKPWRHHISRRQRNNSESKSPSLPQVKDYLHEGGIQERKRQSNIQSMELSKILKSKNMSAFEKYELSQLQLKRLFEKVENKIEKIKASKGYDAKSFEEASELYVNAIQAKLSLLESFT